MDHVGFVPVVGVRRAIYVGRTVDTLRLSATAVRRRANVTMIAAFGPKRSEIGRDYEEDYEYEYIVGVPNNLHEIEVLDIDLRRVPLSTMKGKVVFAINVASKDPKTDKFYRLLVDLHERYHANGLEILAFPCNAFDQREPLSNDEIKSFAEEKYGAQFKLMHKTFLDENPVFVLGHKSFPGEIYWNFHGMFVFDREGNPAQRIPADAPEELIEVKIQEVLERPYSPKEED
mmetsp:Transcript_9254/g.27847  ORF Transcript_9254/g.27847 Transcript_9254/m.27847 type:complete len:231 (-) Transcript_9254:606-1298(-)